MEHLLISIVLLQHVSSTAKPICSNPPLDLPFLSLTHVHQLLYRGHTDLHHLFPIGGELTDARES